MTEDTENLLEKVRKDKVRDNKKFGRFRYGLKDKVQKAMKTMKNKAKSVTNNMSSSA